MYASFSIAANAKGSLTLEHLYWVQACLSLRVQLVQVVWGRSVCALTAITDAVWTNTWAENRDGKHFFSRLLTVSVLSFPPRVCGGGSSALLHYSWTAKWGKIMNQSLSLPLYAALSRPDLIIHAGYPAWGTSKVRGELKQELRGAAPSAGLQHCALDGNRSSLSGGDGSRDRPRDQHSSLAVRGEFSGLGSGVKLFGSR